MGIRMTDTIWTIPDGDENWVRVRQGNMTPLDYMDSHVSVRCSILVDYLTGPWEM